MSRLHDLPFVGQVLLGPLGVKYIQVGFADRLDAVAQAQVVGQGLTDAQLTTVSVLEVDVIR